MMAMMMTMVVAVAAEGYAGGLSLRHGGAHVGHRAGGARCTPTALFLQARRARASRRVADMNPLLLVRAGVRVVH